MKTYCYIRVSTDKQDYDRQINNLNEHGYNESNAIFIYETYTGTKIIRPEMQKLIDTMVEGDTLIVESITRLSRSGVASTMNLIQDLVQNKRVNVKILKNDFNFTAGNKLNANSNLIFGVTSCFAQFERDIISERTIEGLNAKRKMGIIGGKPRNEKTSLENFIKTLKSIINDKLRVEIACEDTEYSLGSFRRDYNMLKDIYDAKSVKPASKRYEFVLNKLLEDMDNNVIKCSKDFSQLYRNKMGVGV